MKKTFSVFLFAVLFLCTAVVSADARVDEDIASLARQQGLVPVIIQLETDFRPVSRQDAATVAAQSSTIQALSQTLLERHDGSGLNQAKTFRHQPFVAATVDLPTYRALSADPLVRNITLDVADEPLLDFSTQQIGANAVWDQSITGLGVSVAILDTGADTEHPFLQNKIIQEVCFSSNFSDENGNLIASSLCPDGVTSVVGPGAAPDCDDASGCGHGTHVTGIAAGFYEEPDFPLLGTAPDAGVVSMQIFSKFPAEECESDGPCVRSFISDQMLALDWIFENAFQYNISAANMSLGGGLNTSPCAQDSRVLIMDALRASGVAVVVASGNNGYRNALNSPACVPSAISVGAVFTNQGGAPADAVVTFSNSASFLDLLAPGVDIASSYFGGYARLSGTSMAAPHVAGAFALYRQADSLSSVDAILEHLQKTGRPIRDPRNGVMTSRIQIDNALLGTSPELAFSPASLDLEMNQFVYEEEYISISNTGNSPLFWNIVPRSNVGDTPLGDMSSPGSAGVIYPHPSLGYDALTVPGGRHGLGLMSSTPRNSDIFPQTPSEFDGDTDAPMHQGLEYFTTFTSSEGFTPGSLIGQVGWNPITGYPQQTSGIGISGVNPLIGDQHVVMQFDPDYDAGTFIGAETPWFGPMSEGIFTFRTNVMITSQQGADYTFWVVTSNRWFPVRLDWQGRILVSDGFFFYASPATWTPGAYQEIMVQVNTFDQTVTYFYEGQAIAQFVVDQLKGISHVSMVHDNWQDGDVAYVDDFQLFGEQVKREWLSTLPDLASGTLQPGESIETRVGIQTFELLAGQYNGEIAFVTNDPAPQADALPIALTVTSGDVDVSYPVTFTVDMSEALGFFDPDIHDVYVSGDFIGWDQPGTNPEAQMFPTAVDSLIYSVTMDVPEGQMFYKFFLVEDEPTWDLGEWDGMADRETFITGPTTLNDVFGVSGDDASLAYLQVIHNSADPSLHNVDVYANGSLFIPGLFYGSAIPYIPIPGPAEVFIEIYPSGGAEDGQSPVFSELVFLEPEQNYRIIAKGVVDPDAFSPNPDDRDISFRLDVIVDPQPQEVTDGLTLHLGHGATDAPGVDIWVDNGPVVISDLRYGDNLSMSDVPREQLLLNVGVAGSAQTGDYLAQFDVPLNWGSHSVTLLGSGFLDPEANQFGSDFQLLFVSSDGDFFPISPFVPSDVVLYAELSDNPVGMGESFELHLYAGTQEQPLSDLAGIGFQMELAPWLARLDDVIPGELMFRSDDDEEVISFVQVPEDSSYVAISFSRPQDLGGVDGDGLLATLSFTSQPGMEGSHGFWIYDMLATNSQGEPLSIEAFSEFLIVANIVTVWPGDTNNDGIVDILDILPVAAGFGEFGPPRGGFNIAWAAQQATPWDNPMLTYADATGDGVINQNDIIPVGFNFGRTRPGYQPPAAPMARAVTDQPAELIIPAGFSGRDVTATVTFEGDVRVDKLLGLAADFSFDQGVSTGEVTAADLLKSEKMILHENRYRGEAGRYSVAMSRLGSEGAVTAGGELMQIVFELDRIPSNDLRISLDRLALSGPDGRIMTTSGFRFDAADLTSAEPGDERPAHFALAQNYPNPFNPATNITFQIADPTEVVLEVFDMLGRRIATLARGAYQPGSHTVSFDAAGLASGIYVYRLQAGSFTETRTMMLVK